MCPKQQWDEMNESLEHKIEAAFPFKKWNEVKNLMQEILKCPRVCISSDFCLAYTDDNQEFSIIDFLQLATRHVGPNKDVTPSQKTNRWHSCSALFLSWLLCWPTAPPSPTSKIRIFWLWLQNIWRPQRKVPSCPLSSMRDLPPRCHSRLLNQLPSKLVCCTSRQAAHSFSTLSPLAFTFLKRRYFLLPCLE